MTAADESTASMALDGGTRDEGFPREGVKMEMEMEDARKEGQLTEESVVEEGGSDSERARKRQKSDEGKSHGEGDEVTSSRGDREHHHAQQQQRQQQVVSQSEQEPDTTVHEMPASSPARGLHDGQDPTAAPNLPPHSPEQHAHHQEQGAVEQQQQRRQEEEQEPEQASSGKKRKKSNFYVPTRELSNLFDSGVELTSSRSAARAIAASMNADVHGSGAGSPPSISAAGSSASPLTLGRQAALNAAKTLKAIVAPETKEGTAQLRKEREALVSSGAAQTDIDAWDLAHPGIKPAPKKSSAGGSSKVGRTATASSANTGGTAAKATSKKAAKGTSASSAASPIWQGAPLPPLPPSANLGTKASKPTSKKAGGFASPAPEGALDTSKTDSKAAGGKGTTKKSGAAAGKAKKATAPAAVQSPPLSPAAALASAVLSAPLPWQPTAWPPPPKGTASPSAAPASMPTPSAPPAVSPTVKREDFQLPAGSSQDGFIPYVIKPKSKNPTAAAVAAREEKRKLDSGASAAGPSGSSSGIKQQTTRKGKGSTAGAARAKASTAVATEAGGSGRASPVPSITLTDASAPREAEKSRTAAAQTVQQVEPEEEVDDRLYCICRQLYDVERMMMGCDNCDNWYHPECLGIDENSVALVDIFICPACEPLTTKRTSYSPKCGRDECHLPVLKLSRYCSDWCGISVAAERLEAKQQEAETNQRKIDLELLWEAVSGLAKSEATVSVYPAATDSDASHDNMADGQIDRVNGEILEEVGVEAAQGRMQAKVQAERASAAYEKLSAQKRPLEAAREIVSARLRYLDVCISRCERLAAAYLASNPTPTIKPKKSKIAGGQPGGALYDAPCGFDIRLIWDSGDFATWLETDGGRRLMQGDAQEHAMDDGRADETELEVEDGIVCMQTRKKCDRHSGWQKTREADYEVEKTVLTRRLEALEDDERTLRQRMDEAREHAHWRKDDQIGIMPTNGDRDADMEVDESVVADGIYAPIVEVI